MHNRYIGVMTGNSMDAADAVLLEFADPPNVPRLLGSAQAHLPAALRTRLRKLASEEVLRVSDLLAAQNDLTDICADAVLQLKVDAASVCAVGCHGQSIAHRPATAATWQILNGARLAERTQMDVVCDFRSRDVASGGQGAPLAPFFHQYFFAAAAPCEIINIGGIANITHLNASGAVTTAYDTGPGMMLMDGWMQQHSGVAYDKNGAFAQSGSVDEDLLRQLLTHPYFSRRAPKSCGREEFSLSLLDGVELPPACVQATLLELTARTIAAAVTEKTVFLCGGGSYNAALRTRLTELLPAPLQCTTAVGLEAQWVEAAAFAYLAKCHMEGVPLVAGSITGGKTRLAGAHYPR